MLGFGTDLVEEVLIPVEVAEIDIGIGPGLVGNNPGTLWILGHIVATVIKHLDLLFSVGIGSVTLEDLIELIMGNIQDEFDHEEEEFHRITEKIYSVDGSAGLDEVNELIGSDLPEDEFDTIAGLILDQLGRIPEEYEHPYIIFSGVKLTVSQVKKRRIVKVLVEPAGDDDKEKY